jgi:hypothetical protein
MGDIREELDTEMAEASTKVRKKYILIVFYNKNQ